MLTDGSLYVKFCDRSEFVYTQVPSMVAKLYWSIPTRQMIMLGVSWPVPTRISCKLHMWVCSISRDTWEIFVTETVQLSQAHSNWWQIRTWDAGPPRTCQFCLLSLQNLINTDQLWERRQSMHLVCGVVGSRVSWGDFKVEGGASV